MEEHGVQFPFGKWSHEEKKKTSALARSFESSFQGKILNLKSFSGVNYIFYITQLISLLDKGNFESTVNSLNDVDNIWLVYHLKHTTSSTSTLHTQNCHA